MVQLLIKYFLDRKITRKLLSNMSGTNQWWTLDNRKKNLIFINIIKNNNDVNS